MEHLHIDFETRSPVNLPQLGSYAYLSDLRTEVLCMAWAFGDEEPALWLPGQPFPDRIAEHIEASGQIWAHNATFERLVFWYHLCPDLGIPEPAIEQFVCTASLARARGLPGKLELASRMIGHEEKSSDGGALIRACCIPPYDEVRLPELFEYCKQDVRAEREFASLLPPLTDSELAQYHASEHINDRGVRIDMAFCKAATSYKEDEVADIGRTLAKVTRGVVDSPTQRERIQNWLVEHDPSDALLSKKTKTGVSISKTALLQYLDEDRLPEARLVAQARLDGANTSVAKYARMVARAEADEDGRIRGAFIFNTAITGRFSSSGAQLHNFVRAVPEDAEQLIADVIEGYEIDNPMSTLGRLLRPSLIPSPGNVFVGGDWSGIEAMLTPWFGREWGGDVVLDVFRRDEDVYVRQAEAMAVGDRQIGKVAVLACGFGGRGNAFASMAANYGLAFSKHEGDAYADAWRRANPWAPELWSALEKAAKAALAHPGEQVPAAGVVYMHWGQWLLCRLPSGRVLYYWRPSLVENKFGGHDIAYVHATYVAQSNVHKPPRVRTWGGKLTENIVQAAAADILREALVRAEKAGICTVAHVHDELLTEWPKRKAAAGRRTLEGIMLTRPAWATDLPLIVDIWSGPRYQK